MSALPDHTGPRAAPGYRPGLRERKKARTRAAIREHAFRLFRAQGYEATTVEQIAEAAEVSPSTFFRYFPTKEDVVIRDDMELRWAGAIRSQPPELSPLVALGAAMADALAGIPADEMQRLHESMQLAASVPAVRARAMDDLGTTIQFISAQVAERAGLDPGDFAVHALAGAVTGVAMAAWFASPGDLQEYAGKFRRGLSLLEAGLPLPPRPPS
jgi:AcrR family transcriptional regulator